jgi:hypothetical protein
VAALARVEKDFSLSTTAQLSVSWNAHTRFLPWVMHAKPVLKSGFTLQQGDDLNKVGNFNQELSRSYNIHYKTTKLSIIAVSS